MNSAYVRCIPLEGPRSFSLACVTPPLIDHESFVCTMSLQ